MVLTRQSDMLMTWTPSLGVMKDEVLSHTNTAPHATSEDLTRRRSCQQCGDEQGKTSVQMYSDRQLLLLAYACSDLQIL